MLADKNPDAARRAVVALADAVESLTMFPDRGRQSDVSDVRELIVPFGRSSYILRYAHLVETNEIVILRIWHGRQARE